MTSREPLSPDEQALAERLHGWATGGPSAQLDDRILAQSRAAVGAKRVVRRPWLVSVASAAALVLTVGVVWRVSESPRSDDLPFEAPAIPMSHRPVTNEEQPTGRAGVADARMQPAEGTAGSVDGELREALPATPVPQPEPSADAAAEQSTAAQRSSLSRSVNASPTPAQPVMRARQTAPPPAAPPPPPASPEPAPQATTAFPELSPPTVAPYALPAAPSAPVVSVPERAERGSSDDRAAGRSGGSDRPARPAESAIPMDSEPETYGKTDARNRLLQDSAAAQAEGPVESTVELSGDFATDVAIIRTLVVQARNAEAVRSIAELRRRHPRKQVPVDLLAIERGAGRDR
jgi:hypothetical protein